MTKNKPNFSMRYVTEYLASLERNRELAGKPGQPTLELYPDGSGAIVWQSNVASEDFFIFDNPQELRSHIRQYWTKEKKVEADEKLKYSHYLIVDGVRQPVVCQHCEGIDLRRINEQEYWEEQKFTYAFVCMDCGEQSHVVIPAPLDPVKYAQSEIPLARKRRGAKPKRL